MPGGSTPAASHRAGADAARAQASCGLGRGARAAGRSKMTSKGQAEMRAATNGTTVATRGMAKEAKSRGGPDQDLIRELASLLEETGLSEIEIEREGLRVRVARQQALAATTMVASPVAAALAAA